MPSPIGIPTLFMNSSRRECRSEFFKLVDVFYRPLSDPGSIPGISSKKLFQTIFYFFFFDFFALFVLAQFAADTDLDFEPFAFKKNSDGDKHVFLITVTLEFGNLFGREEKFPLPGGINFLILGIFIRRDGEVKKDGNAIDDFDF